MKKSIAKTTKGKGKAKGAAKAAPIRFESAGDCLFGNIWYKIGLTKAEVPMIKTIGCRLYQKPVRSALVLRALLLASMAHYDLLEPFIFNDAAYSEKENFLLLDDYWHGAIKAQHAKIAERKKEVPS